MEDSLGYHLHARNSIQNIDLTNLFGLQGERRGVEDVVHLFSHSILSFSPF